ncbi:hypothetical protein SESBI_16670 [Sesbania bispinosa]|nr:hypothetical protein SESBI_16670 [Sesbania bispinosa]
MVQCAMFGSYIDMVGDLLNGMDPELPVLMVMFAKVKLYKDVRAVVHGIDILAPMGVIVDDYRSSPPKDEFLNAQSQKTIK